MPKVPKLKPDLSETEQIVVSVLESFHETSEPDFFKEYRDPPYTKLVDPYSDDRSDREVDDDGGNEAPLLAEGNRRLEKVLKQLSDVKRRTVVALMFLGAAESQVAATIAAAAEVEPKTAPSDVSLFRAFGISATDIFYPKLFEGYWDVDSVLVDVDIPGGIEQLSLSRLGSIREKLDKHEKWEVRYINHKGNIIADRVYNTVSLIGSEVQKFRCIWNPDAPNFFRMEVATDPTGKKTNLGMGIESLVTRRSFDSPASGIFDSSEFSRETQDNRRVYNGPPTIGAKQISSRYKWDPTKELPDEIKVIQKIATFDVPNDGDSLGKDVETLLRMLSATTRPTVIKKYVSRMTRKLKPAT